MAVKFFDVLTSVINKKNIPEEEIEKQFKSYIAIKWLSNNPGALLVSNYLNSYRGNSNINDKCAYQFLRNAINLPKNTFIKFDKKQKENILIQKIQEKYKVSNQLAEEYLEILPANILEEMKKDKNGI